MAAADPVAANPGNFGMPVGTYPKHTVEFTGSWPMDSILLTFLDQYHDFAGV